MNDMVLQKLESGLLTITMNRPDRRNALNPDMTRGLVEAARRAAEDHEVRAVLLKGAGGTFCVGGDVKSMAEGRAPLPFEAKMVNLRRGMEVSRILHQMAKARGGSTRWRRGRRRTLHRAVLRSARRLGFGQDHHRLRQGRSVRRLRRHLFPDANARQRQGARTVSAVAGADGAGSTRARSWSARVVPDAEVEAAAHELAMSLAQGPSITLGYIKKQHQQRRASCRWKPVSTPRQSITPAPARPPTTRKPPKPLSKSASLPSRAIEVVSYHEIAADLSGGAAYRAC